MKIESWPKELDALIAAPDHHTLLFENEKVRVLDTLIKPNDITPIHTHENASVFYILSWSNFVRYDGDGEVLADTRNNNEPPPAVLWGEPLGPHAIKNVGSADLHVIGFEVKKPAN